MPFPTDDPAAVRVSLSRLARTLTPWLTQFGLVIAIVVIAAVLSASIPNFLTWKNLLNVALQISINGILAIGVTYVLLTGGVDLSLGSVVALAGVVAACFAHPGQYPVVVPILLGILTGAACGVANGLVTTKGRVAPFIVTLGMMTAARGLAFVISGGKPVSSLSQEFRRLGEDLPGVHIPIGGGESVGIPIPVVILVAVAVASLIFLRNMRLGRYIYAVGGNEHAARASGLRVDGIKLFTYMVCGALAGLAGVVLASRITTGQPNAAAGYELDAIAAVVIGGTSLSGGVGGVGGTLLGALLMGIINAGLDQLGVSSYYQQIIKGLLIVSAAWLDKSRRK